MQECATNLATFWRWRSSFRLPRRSTGSVSRQSSRPDLTVSSGICWRRFALSSGRFAHTCSQRNLSTDSSGRDARTRGRRSCRARRLCTAGRVCCPVRTHSTIRQRACHSHFRTQAPCARDVRVERHVGHHGLADRRLASRNIAHEPWGPLRRSDSVLPSRTVALPPESGMTSTLRWAQL
jgi:hypothetical protein